MNITSVSGQELHKILFGKDVQANITLLDKNTGEPFKARRGEMPPARDSFALSAPQRVDPDTSSIISLFETGSEIYSQAMAQGLWGFATDKELVNYFADIGRRLDEAYAEGKFTEEEYNALNDSLKEYIAYKKERNDLWRAERELIRSYWKNAPVNIMTGDAEKDKQTMDAFFAEQKKAVEKILNRPGFRTPLEKIMEMINNIRYGNSANIVDVMLGQK